MQRGCDRLDPPILICVHSGEFLGLSSGKADLSWTLPVVDEICSGAGSIFGGAALGAAISALEMAAERPLVWATGQFISYSKPPEEITVDVTIRAAGKGTTQAFCLAHVDGRPVIEVMAALGNRDSALHNSWVERLEVPAPDDCPVSTFLSDRPTISSRFERRLARGNLDRDNDPAVPDGRSALWFKIPDELDVDAGVLGILGDYVPFGAHMAIGPQPTRTSFTSLDNTIRVVELVPTTWVLADVQIFSITNGFCQGIVHLWAEDGTLLATASQTSQMRAR